MTSEWGHTLPISVRKSGCAGIVVNSVVLKLQEVPTDCFSSKDADWNGPSYCYLRFFFNLEMQEKYLSIFFSGFLQEFFLLLWGYSIFACTDQNLYFSDPQKCCFCYFIARAIFILWYKGKSWPSQSWWSRRFPQFTNITLIQILYT